MAMLIGDVNCTTGASKLMWDALSVAGMPGAQQPSEDAAAYAERVTALKKVCYATAHIITEVKKADVSTTVNVTSVSLVTPGTGVSGPGAGNGSGTIT